ncbi:hypothetical protein LX69_03018 [Breznakibacter xylanolyticus]|uniref:HD/PDEase domain-containing protein n=1 Tax=Breznakibacter xylanolyticus TaxID=990 RepID=A0A2W7NKQ0_9BACT|nr:HDIG domain-containing protein [Marinilabiliaceae bacterium]PZX11872.1 hypothetical protein LX69_03018 [Breznakibacter xylanolyticus]
MFFNLIDFSLFWFCKKPFVVKRILTPLTAYGKLTYKILLFMVAAGLVLYMFPRSGKFRYEYAKGRFWKHSVLIAGFDFPIIKTPEQLKTERDSVLRFFRPYFVLDSSLWDQDLSRFDADYQQLVPQLRDDYRFLHTGGRYPERVMMLKLGHHIQNRLKNLYQRGIIELPESMASVDEHFEFKLIRGNFAEPYGLSEMYTPKNAYRVLSDQVRRYMVDSLLLDVSANSSEYASFVSRLQLNRYLNPSVKYDQQRSDVERQNLQKQLSTTSGAVRMGQRIIGPGEMVDDQMMQVLDSYKAAFEANLLGDAGYTQILIGQILIVVSFFTGVLLFLYFFRHDVYQSNKSVLFILMMMVGMVFLARVSSTFYYIPMFVIPFTMLPITVRTFFDSRLALFIHIMTILLASFFAQNGFQFAFIQILVGVTAIFSLYRIERRSQLLKTSILIVLVYMLLYTSLFLWQEGDIRKINPVVYGHFAFNGGLLLLTYLVIYIIEKLFGFLSDVTLAELSNTNHPLLLKMAEMAPGTFHHSIQVGNLAVAAVKKIGGNPLLVYAGAMYHDIGKMEAPSMFTENQLSGFNPLTEMDLEDGARMVISHIENGARLARKHKLPEQIIDFIVTHQGTTRTKYFYNTYVNRHPDKQPDMTHFQYPGPIPFSKETAVLMMADSVEAASRSLVNYSDEEIDRLVERIVADQIEQGQFADAPLTFREMTQVKEVFKQRLKIMYHTRIQYPEIHHRQASK